MSRADETRWRWRLLVLEMLLFVVELLVLDYIKHKLPERHCDVLNRKRHTEFEERARALRKSLEVDP